MTQRIKTDHFYLEIQTEGTTLSRQPSAEQPVTAEKSDVPEPLEKKQYIYRPNDPFQSAIDRIEAAGIISVTHKPWIKTAWLYLFVIGPVACMELFALALKFKASGGWPGFAILNVMAVSYGLLSYSIWLNKTKGPATGS
jgi:Rad3-related DNA helicase